MGQVIYSAINFSVIFVVDAVINYVQERTYRRNFRLSTLAKATNHDNSVIEPNQPSWFLV